MITLSNLKTGNKWHGFITDLHDEIIESITSAMHGSDGWGYAGTIYITDGAFDFIMHTNDFLGYESVNPYL